MNNFPKYCGLLGMICLWVSFSVNAQITIDLQLNKTNDVAPFKLHVDASGTEDPSITSTEGAPWNFHNLHYEWDFGDDPEATWTYTGRSKNIGYGAIYGHVYDQPGSYTVTLTVTNPLTGTTATTQRTITVTDPDVVFSGNNTICFSTSGDFTGAPAGALQITTSDLKQALDTYARTGKRLLFRRGETWMPSDNPNRIIEDGPGIIGAFGTGPKPVLRTTPGVGRIIITSEGIRNTTTNWRIMDLEIDGTPNTQAQAVTIGGNDMLVYRVDMHDVNGGIGFGASLLELEIVRNGATPLLHSDFGIVDCTINRIGNTVSRGGSVGIFGASEKLLIMGNQLHDNTNGEHNIRLTFATKCIIAHNDIAHPARSKQTLTIRSQDYQNETGVFRGKGDTREIIVSDNRLFADGTFLMNNSGIGNGNGEIPRSFDVILERNFIESGGTVTSPFDMYSFRSTVRNNIMLSRNGGGITLVKSERGDGTPHHPEPMEAKIYNNSMLPNRGSAVLFRSRPIALTECEVYNTLILATDDTNSPPTGIRVNSATTDAMISNNRQTLSPGTVSATYNSPNDFSLQPTSPLIDQGRRVPNPLDFFGNRRDINAIDVGAVEYTTRPSCISSITPEDGAIDVAVDADISWPVVANADGYRISIGTTAGGIDVENNRDLGTNTTYTPSPNWDEDTTYFIRIIPYNVEGDAQGCAEIQFTTEKANVVPSCTVVTSPADGAVDVSLEANINWDAIPEASSYQITIGTSSGAGDIENNNDLGDVTTYILEDTEQWLPNTTYYVTVVPKNATGDAMGCTETRFTTEEALAITNCPIDQEVPCNADTLADYTQGLTINKGGTAQFTQTPAAATPMDMTTQSITITAVANGETATCEFTVTRAENSVDAGADTSIIRGENTTLIAAASTNNGTYAWTPPTGLNTTASATVVASPEETTTYTIVYTNTDGCSVEDMITVTVLDPPNATKYGFSPDNDGINDCWILDGIEATPDNEVSIYNRWNDLVYQVQGYDNQNTVFCGVANMKKAMGADELPEGTYFFRIKVNGQHTLPQLEGFLVLKR